MLHIGTHVSAETMPCPPTYLRSVPGENCASHVSCPHHISLKHAYQHREDSSSDRCRASGLIVPAIARSFFICANRSNE